MVLFVHTTPNKYAKSILKDGEIRSYSKTKKAGIGEGENIMNPDMIYLTALFDYYKVAIPNSNNTYLFFDKNVLIDNTTSHYCNLWEWGKITEDCIKYNNKLSVDDNIDSWQKSYKNIFNINKHPQRYIYGPLENFNAVINEVVFKDKVNLKNLIGIYSSDAKWKHPLLMTKQEELKEFLKKYNIIDVDTNPNDNYYIPFSINWTEEKHKEVADKWLNWASKQIYYGSEWKKWKAHINRRKTRKNIRK